ncbi:MAG: dienelactone hydrolase family protein [Actinomycetota bacterium]
MTQRPERPAGWRFHPGRPVVEPLDFVAELGGDPPLFLHLIHARDGAYLPAVVRRPSGAGPWPAVMCFHGGSGGLGHSFLVHEMRNRGWLFDRLVKEGYLVCHTEGRMENEDQYAKDLPAVLDHHDVAEAFHYLQRSDEVDPERIATFGVSHGGELQMKLITEIGEGPAAMVPCEPAVIEYLGLRHEGDSEEGWAVEDSSGPRVEEKLQFRGPVADDDIDFPAAWERIQRVSDAVAILVVGRDDDHLQGLFKKLHELLTRAGKNAQWATWDHPEHAYQWGPERRSGHYAPDEVQQATLDAVVDFLNRNVRDRSPQQSTRTETVG